MGGEELLAKKVSREMYATKGDTVAYTQILLNHYKASTTLAQKKLVVQRPAALDVDVALDVNLLTTRGQQEMMTWTMNNAARLKKTKLQSSH